MSDEQAAFKAKSLKRKNVKGLKLGGSDPSARSTTPSLQDAQAPGGVASRYYDQKDRLSEQLSTLEIGVEFKLDLKSEDLKIIDELGAGNGGTVTKVIHKATKTIMARKVIHIDAKPAVRKQIVRELHIMHECHSPYIVSFYGAFLNEGDVVMCMEYMDCGSLDYIAKKIGPFRIDVLGKIAEAVVEGLAYLYDVHRILHRDVKPSNILVNSRGSIKLCDFGVSGELINSIANTFVGTSTYMSPERIQGAQYSVKSDVWSLGLSLLELAIGHFPFDADATSADNRASAGPMGILDLLQKIVNEPAPKLPPNKAFPKSLETMIENCLIKDPELRPSPRKLLQEEVFMRSAKSTNVDLEAWAHEVIGLPLGRAPRPSQLVTPNSAHRESPAPPRPVSREQLGSRRPSLADSQQSSRRPSASDQHSSRRPSASDQHSSRRPSASDRGADYEREHRHHHSNSSSSRSGSIAENLARVQSANSQGSSSRSPSSAGHTRHQAQKSYTESTGSSSIERERERDRAYRMGQGNIGIGAESGAAAQPEMKERKRAPPMSVMSSGGHSGMGMVNGTGPEWERRR